MWKPEHRRSADRNGLRYPSDLTDTEWGIVEPMIPPARHGGAATVGECARGAERDFLHPVDRLPMEGLSTCCVERDDCSVSLRRRPPSGMSSFCRV